MKKSSLNHCYKLVWNSVLQSWVAVAEHVKSHGKQSGFIKNKRNKPTLFALANKAKIAWLVFTAFSSIGISQTANAQWEGLNNTHGRATYKYDGTHLDVHVKTHQLTATARSLDIAKGESVNIHQLTAQDTALFRSIGPGATEIFGSLTANGKVFLVNQNGILFGQGAQVDVGSLVATSMNISDSDFLKGQHQFHANSYSGSVVNHGVIKVADGGYVVLLGQHVENTGSIVANQGSVVMASAEHAELDFYGNGLVKAKLSGDALNAVINQSGHIQADGGTVQLATTSRSSAVNVSGIVQANTLVERDGVIRLEGGDYAKVAVTGTLKTAGEQAGLSGGQITVTGEQVALLSDATLDASGEAGGGAVLVGGDYQGNNNTVYNARTTYVGQNTRINVDANQNGDGGKAIVWSDQTTRHYGEVSAKGGEQSGDGGFVEISGKQNLAFAGQVDVAAANGTGGTVLFDPENIVLNNSTQTAPSNNADGTPDVAFADAPAIGTTTIQINDVRGFSELYLQATNDITVANTLSMLTDNSVFLEANHDINVNAEISTRGTGAITLNADNDVNLNGRLNSYGSGAINVTADADSSGAGDININQRVFARTGGINFNAANVVSTTTAGYLQTQGNLNQDSSDINVTASNTINMASNIISTGRNSAAGFDGVSGGDVNLTAAGAITVNNISAYGGNGGTGNTAGGDAGTITIQSTGTAGAINTGTLNARNGVARGTGAGGAAASINITNASGDIDTKNIYVHGNTNANAGDINLTASNGNITATGNVYASGGGTAAGSTAAGGNGGNITMNASGDVTVISRVYAQGATPRNGNTAVGGNAGNVNVSGENLNFNNVIYAYGGNGRGIDQAGGHGGVINLNATGAITASNNVYAYGGSGATGSNSDAGNAGTIAINSTGAGDITTGRVNARNGAARGTGAGGATGSITINNSNGNINTRNLQVEGNLNGHGGDIAVAAATGDVTVTGVVYSYGGSVNNGHTLAGRDGGDINISGVNRTITGRVNANGNTAKGVDQAGGNAGTVNITGSGTLNVADVYSRNGRATDAGAGGNVGSINMTGTSITTTNLYTAGERNGDGGNINLTSTSGDIATTGIYVQAGGANTNTAGNNAGNITINSAGGFSAVNHLYAYGSNGNGAGNNGGNAGAIDVAAAGAISAKRIYAYGGNGGGNNALTNLAAGGNAGSVTLNSTAAGDITLTDTINVRTGSSRGAAPGATAGSIDLVNANGNINTRNIRAEGQNHGNGSDVTINAGTTGDVTVDGVIYTYGDRDATNTTFVGTDGGDINITAANTTVTSTISTDGGRGRGANQIGGNAGDLTMNASGAISTQTIVANGGNAGAGAGSNAAGGNAGDISLTSTGAGDITATNISARTGYTRGNATAAGAGSVTIINDDGQLTATSISTRGQRRGVGGDVLAISAGDFNVTTVDARASNLTAADDGDITIGTKTIGDTTVNSVLTQGRWLVYSGDPRNDTIGAFKPNADFKQYNTNYGDALLDSGDGFVYRFAPIITTSLTGTATKPYDGNTVAPIAGLTLNQIGGEIDGDVITISGLTSARYNNSAVGSGKTVTSNPLSVVNGINGTTTVYGYQVETATGNIGVITESAQSRLEAAAESNPRNDAGLGALITTESSPQQFVTVFDVNATAAGGDGTENGCQTEEDQTLQNPNTTLMLNFGITLPEGVEQTCDE